MIETVILLVVFVPLMFAMPMIGKLIDLRQTAIQAGRYATWEATVANGADRRADQVASRFFGRADAALSSDPVEPGENVMWGGVSRDAGEDSERGVRSGPTDLVGWTDHAAIGIDDTTVVATPWSTGHGDLGAAGTVGKAIRQAGRALGGNKWDLAKTTLTRAEVGVDVSTNGWFENQGVACGEGIGGCVRESGVILVDGWSVGSDVQAKRRVQALVPATHLKKVGKLLSKLGVIPVMRELDGMEDMFGHVDTRPLPAHADRGMDTYREPE